MGNAMTFRSWVAWFAAGVLVLVVIGGISAVVIRSRWRQERPDIAGGQAFASIPVRSSSFADGDRIPFKFTCNGASLSPDIQLPPPPSGTKSFFLEMDDSDAWGFIHWLVYNIPPDTRDIPEGASSHKALPAGAAEGENSMDDTGYAPPCPPGSNAHHYVFRVYALDTNLALPAGQTKKELAAAVKGHILAEGGIAGVYTHGGS
jgi:Raf kinase inhibitor-like YbhB/YbcL family protein